MKKLLLATASLLLATAAAAQLYVPGETLNYRMSYRARFFPNTEVAKVVMQTTEATLDGIPAYKVYGYGQTTAAFRWILPVRDAYTVWVDPQTLRTRRFDSDLHEGDYTFRSTYRYDWEQMRVHTRWQSRQRPIREKELPLTRESMDAISLFFSLRSAEAEQFRAGEPRTLQMVLQDTVRHLHFRFLGREEKKIRNLGRFRTLKFDCQLGTSEGFSFTDGTVFTIWISDDENKIPLYLESPVRIGSINAYLSGYKGLKYPLKSRIK